MVPIPERADDETVRVVAEVFTVMERSFGVPVIERRLPKPSYGRVSYKL
jgi:hypothetical protein